MRTKQQIKSKQGALTVQEVRLANRMRQHPKAYFTSLTICEALVCVSARDRVRKMIAAGVPIGPAKLLYIGKSGNRVFGWRMA